MEVQSQVPSSNLYICKDTISWQGHLESINQMLNLPYFCGILHGEVDVWSVG